MRLRSRKRSSPHQTIVLWIVLAVVFAVLGVWVLATDDRPWIGIGYLLVGVVWGVLAFLGWWKPKRVFRNPERA
jgi:uncharacterized membrane protein